MDDAKRAEAAYTLSDDITALQFALERAETVMHEIREDYFGKFNSETEDGRFCISWEYDRNGIFADIVTDYLFDVRKTLEELSNLEDIGAKLARQRLKGGGQV